MTTLRERPKVITLSDAAAAHVKTIMDKVDNSYIAVRLGVENGGCAGMAYTMDYAEEQNPLDEVVIDKGVKILIDLRYSVNVASVFFTAVNRCWNRCRRTRAVVTRSS